jgi:hypothetical protein
MSGPPNKHGFPGVRKRVSAEHHRKPYYARLAIGCEKFVYSRNFETAEEAGEAFQKMKMKRSAEKRQ